MLHHPLANEAPRESKYYRHMKLVDGHRDTRSPQVSSTVFVLFFLVLIRFVLYAFYLPVFEGPDEPFHLARVTSFFDEGFMTGIRGKNVSGEIVSAVKSNPCGPDLSRAFGCPLFDGTKAGFNGIRPSEPDPDPPPPVPNYEAHQPPLFYLATGVVVGVANALPSPIAVTSAKKQLLLVRLIAVGLVAVALAWPLRRLSECRGESFRAAVLLLLLVPGASEALARCAIDSAVFLWSAFLVYSIHNRKSTPLVALLLAIGPLIKLTAIPIVIFGVVALWRQRGAAPAFAARACSLLFLPIQFARGWLWGGTVELNVASVGLDEPLITTVVGLARSIYTFTKTTLWLGGWSFFRPPTWLMILCAVLIFGWLISRRLRPSPEFLVANLLAFLTLCVGFLVFAVNHRLYFDTWGGVGGWYAWGWFPWIAFAASDLFMPRWKLPWSFNSLLALAVVLLNIFWCISALGLYGV